MAVSFLIYRIYVLYQFVEQGRVKGNLLVKVAGCYRKQKNACRDLTRLIKRTSGTMLNLPISVCKVHVRLRKPSRCAQVWWPVLELSEWCKYFIANKPELLLGGHTLKEDWQGMLRQFWEDYRVTCPQHPLFSRDVDPGTFVPYFIHGDEGRGQLKRPYMVVSWQCMISHAGPGVCNDTSYLDTHLLLV